MKRCQALYLLLFEASYPSRTVSLFYQASYRSKTSAFKPRINPRQRSESSKPLIDLGQHWSSKPRIDPYGDLPSLIWTHNNDLTSLVSIQDQGLLRLVSIQYNINHILYFNISITERANSGGDDDCREEQRFAT